MNMLSLFLMIFISLTTFANTGIDSNCANFVKENKLASFTNQQALESTYQERKETLDYLKKNKYPVSEYYQLVEKYPLTGNYEVDKFNPVLDTERQYDFEKIKKNYRNVISEVQTTTNAKNYSEQYFDAQGNFRSTHQCTDNPNCLGYRAYCSEQMASKSVVDHMQLYMRVNDACEKGALRKDQTPESFIKECDKAISNLNYLSLQGKDIQKIAESKSPKAQDFFYGVNKEFSAFKNKWDSLKAVMLEQKKKYEAEQKQKELDALLAKQNAEADKKFEPLREEMNKCAALSIHRDSDVKNRKLAQGLCARMGAPADSLKEYDKLKLTDNQFDQLENDVSNIEQKVVDQMAEKISQSAFHQSLMSLWLVEKPIPKTLEEAKASACKTAPDLCKIKGFDKSIAAAFDEFNLKLKDKAYKSLDLEGRKDALYSDIKPSMKKMNELCSAYRSKIQGDLDQWKDELSQEQPKYYQQDNTRVDPTRVNNQIDQTIRGRDSGKLLEELLPLYAGMVNSPLGHLLMTDTFKGENGKGYFSPQKMEEHCLYGDGQLFKDVSESDIQKADGEFRTLVKDELKKINNDFGQINKLEKNSVSDFLKLDDEKRNAFISQYLKTNPLTLIKMLQENPNPDFVKALCKYIMSIEDEDYRKRVGEYIVAGLGFVAGVALSCTGIGTPLGVSLLAFSMGITAVQVGQIIDDKMDHSKQAKLLEQSGATGQIEFDIAIRESLEQEKLSAGGVGEVLWVVGPQMAGFGIGKLAKLGSAISKMERFSSLKKLTGLSNKTVVLEKGVSEVTSASKGIAYIESKVWKEFLQSNKAFSALNQEEVLEMGSVMNALDDPNKTKFLAKLQEFQTPAEMRAFLKQVHLNIDDLIVQGKLSPTKLFAVAEKSALKTSEPFQELKLVEKEIQQSKAPDPSPSKYTNNKSLKQQSRIDYEQLNQKDYAFYKYVIEKDINVKNPYVVNKQSSIEKLAQMHENNSAKDMKYLVENNKVKANFEGGESDVFINPSNKNEALKVWKDNRLGDFELSVKTITHYEQKVSQNKILNEYLHVAQIKEKGSNYIVKEFFQESVELKTVLNNPEVKNAIKKIKNELLRKPDVLDQKLYKTISRVPPSANLHWDPQTQKIILIDALGF